MDYEPYDSSGTDDDLPPSHQNRMPRGNRISGNGRPTSIGAMPYPSRMYGENDMEAQIHQLEKEAYSSVLRAFKAQADAITWEKEGLITELRKELRLSNEEHKELLAMVDKDDLTRRIREWRQKGGGHQPGILGASHVVHDPVPSPSISAHRKNKKMGGSLPSQSFSNPTPSFHTQPAVPANQPSSSAAKRGPMLGPKGKKYKPGQMLPGAPSVNMQYPPTGPTGRNQFSNQVRSGGLATESAEAAPFNLIGRKVRTRWPDDNNFYEAEISDYNHNEGRHALVYDKGTVNETWEWVNLSEIPPEDIQWDGEEPGVAHHGGFGQGNGLNRPRGRDAGPGPGPGLGPGPGPGPGQGPGPGPGPGTGRGRMMSKGHPRKEFPATQNGVGKKGSDYIRLLQTDTLIKEVERIFSAGDPDPQEAEKAKKVLKEHEQALVDAIGRLADISDGESDGGGHFLHGQSMEVE